MGGTRARSVASAERLAVRNVVVTGVTRGCGRALAVELARAGQRVHGCGRTPEQLEELRGELGGEHTWHAVDVSDEAAVTDWAQELVGTHGAPDLVVNNAGLINASAPLWEVAAGEIDRVIDVNLKGTAWVLRAFLPTMIARGHGVVANFSSGWGRTTAANVAPYCATKWAVEGLSQAVAQELPPGLAVLAVNPGIIHTQMLESCWGEGAGSYESPQVWARRAAPFLLELGARDNGRAASIP